MVIKTNREVLEMIKRRVLHRWQCPVIRLQPTVRTQNDLGKFQPSLDDYVHVGALKEIPWSEDIEFFLPWFVLNKIEPLVGIKGRLI